MTVSFIAIFVTNTFQWQKFLYLKPQTFATYNQKATPDILCSKDLPLAKKNKNRTFR